MICSSEYYKKKLIFTNTKNSKNTEIYANVLKELGQKYGDVSFPFSVDQLRDKFKKCVSECKKIALTVKTSTGVKRVQYEKQLGLASRKATQETMVRLTTRTRQN